MAAVAAPIAPTRLTSGRRSPPRPDRRDAMREWLLPTQSEPSRPGSAHSTRSLAGNVDAQRDIAARAECSAPRAFEGAARQEDAPIISGALSRRGQAPEGRGSRNSRNKDLPPLETAFQFLDTGANSPASGVPSPRSPRSPVFPSASSPPGSPITRSPMAMVSASADRGARGPIATPNRPKTVTPATSAGQRLSSASRTIPALTPSPSGSSPVATGTTPSSASSRPSLSRTSASAPAAPVLAPDRPTTPRSLSEGTQMTSQGSKDKSKRMSGLFRRGLFGRSKLEPSTPSPVQPSAEFPRTGTASPVATGADSPRRNTPKLSISTQAASGIAAYCPDSPQPLPTHSPSLRSLTPATATYFDRPALATPQTWRSTLDNDTIVHLTLQHGHDEMRRQEIIYEIIETETGFVESMRTITAVYGEPIRSGAVQGVPRSVARLFSRLERILDLHTRLILTLAVASETQTSGRLVMHFADLFAPYVAEFEVYQAYLLRFEAVTALLESEAASSDGPFAVFLKDLADRPEAGGMTLSSFLLKPIQRLMKYPLFFARLLDSTTDSHPDHHATADLSEDIDEMVRALQEVKMREEEYESLKLLESELVGLPSGFRLAQRTRTLLFEGTVRQLHLTERDRSALDQAHADTAEPRPSLRARAPSENGRAHSDLRSTSLSATPRRSSDRALPLRERPISAASSMGASASSASASDSSPSIQTTSTRPSTASSERSATFATCPPAPPITAPVKSLREPPPPPLPPQSKRSSLTAPPTHAPLAVPEQIKVQAPPKLHIRAKESAMHIWVFSDLVLLARREDTAKLSRSERRHAQPPRKLLEDFGTCRLVHLVDFAQMTDYDLLLELVLKPLAVSDMTRESRSSLYLIPPLRLKSPSSRPGSSSSALSAISGFSSRMSSSAASSSTVTPDLDTATFCNLHAALKSTSSETAPADSPTSLGGDYWISRVRQVRADMRDRRNALRSTRKSR
ncbi:hypothetical protein BMF94_1810 [Rhodotorula taiwanensis]|uniref:DH domain-containing protein n=1 Tax=Rhodotorula taiwanensis TaxID=741276 RepID=A0A2S5BEH7_9BASI|nr:hypothetical protein BMF94_1810 [Rhodotorula taiwanensis]